MSQTSLTLSESPEPHIEASNCMGEEIPGIQLSNRTKCRTNIDFDARLSHEDDVVSIKSDESNDRRQRKRRC